MGNAGAFQLDIPVLKVEESLGLVLGWGMICAKGGKPYLDLDDEGITPTEMLKSVTEFAATSRETDDSHNEVPDGQVVHSFPITDDIAKAFGIEFPDDPEQVTEGWMVAVRPSADVLAKFVDGTYTGFSIGGNVQGYDVLRAAS